MASYTILSAFPDTPGILVLRAGLHLSGATKADVPMQADWVIVHATGSTPQRFFAAARSIVGTDGGLPVPSILVREYSEEEIPAWINPYYTLTLDQCSAEDLQEIVKVVAGPPLGSRRRSFPKLPRRAEEEEEIVDEIMFVVGDFVRGARTFEEIRVAIGALLGLGKIPKYTGSKA